MTRSAGASLFRAMKVDKLKVRPKKMAAQAPCAAEFASVLACWASSNDIRSQSTCQEPTRALRECMATRVRLLTYAAPRGQPQQADDQLSSRALLEARIKLRHYTNFPSWRLHRLVATCSIGLPSFSVGSETDVARVTMASSGRGRGITDAAPRQGEALVAVIGWGDRMSHSGRNST